jgi:hypothetical protein
METHPKQAAVVEFQTLLRLGTDGAYDDAHLAQIAELCVEALRTEATGLALGPVASVDLDQRIIELEMTIEAPSDAELHQKMGLILAALERGAPLCLRESTSSRSPDRDLVCA